MRTTGRLAIMATLALAVALAGCGDDDDDSDETGTASPPSTGQSTGTTGTTGTTEPAGPADPADLDRIAGCLAEAGVDASRTGAGPGGLTDSLSVVLVEEDTAGGIFVYDTVENATKARESTQLTVDAIGEGGRNEVAGTTQYWIGSDRAADTFETMQRCVVG